MMVGHTANAKKASKFEDSNNGSGIMPKPRSASELPQRPSPRMKAAAGSEASGGVPRRPVGVRGTAPPRSPLHEKKPVSAADSRVAELEAKLEKAHGQLAEMREQLTAAEKARKEARAALVEAKKRFAAKIRDDVAISAVEGEEVANGVNGGMSMLATTDVLDAVALPSELENNEDAIPNPEVDELWAKLMAKDTEAYELRAKLMVRDTEVDELRGTLMTKNTELDVLREKLASNDTEVKKLAANLMAKDADIAALEADNADLTRIAEEAGEAAKATAARVRETEHALRESAAREARLAELLRAAERAREALEAEAQRGRVQSEQWRKAAEEAAVVLGGGERASANGADEEGAGGKRKSGGAMRVLSDMWRKKPQK